MVVDVQAFDVAAAALSKELSEYNTSLSAVEAAMVKAEAAQAALEEANTQSTGEKGDAVVALDNLIAVLNDMKTALSS